MEQKTRIVFAVTLIAVIFTGCTHQIILLSPADRYELGNYYLEKEDFNAAGDQFEYLRNNYPTSEYATMSQFKLAQTLLARKKYEEAAIDFELFLDFHPAHKLAPEAQYNLAISKFKSKLNPERDTTMAKESLLAFNTFVSLYPDHPEIQNARQYKRQLETHLLTHEYEVGMVYYRRRAYHAALNRFNPILDSCQDPGLKVTTLYMIGRCLEHQHKYEESQKTYQQILALGGISEWESKARTRLVKVEKSLLKTTQASPDPSSKN